MIYLAITSACLLCLFLGWHLGSRGRINGKYERGFHNGGLHGDRHWHAVVAMRAIALLRCLRSEDASGAIPALEHDVDFSIIGLCDHAQDTAESQVPKDIRRIEDSIDRLFRKHIPDMDTDCAVEGIIAQYRAEFPSVEGDGHRKFRISQFVASHG